MLTCSGQPTDNHEVVAHAIGLDLLQNGFGLAILSTSGFGLTEVGIERVVRVEVRLDRR